MSSLSVVDLFAGAGGLSLGLARAGFRPSRAFDRNPAAIETYRRNLPGAVESACIRGDTECPAAVVVVGGPPCQGFSSAGLRRAGDPRNTLVSAFARIVARARPRAFVFENVEGFLTNRRGRAVRELLEPLIAAGYRVHLRKINAANYGVPQNRKRVLAIGGLGFDPSFPEPTHSTHGAPGVHSVGAGLPPTGTVADAVGDLPEPARRQPGRPSDHYEGKGRQQAIQALAPGQTMRSLPEEYWHPSYRRRACRRVKDGTPSERRGGPPTGLRRLRNDEPSKTITGGAIAEFVHPTRDRFLTLRECARIQTFPDSFEFHGSRTERAALIGNAVPPLLAEAIGRCLALDLRRERRSARGGGGMLLSFAPALSNGASPALREAKTAIEAEFPPLSTQKALF